MVLVDVHTRLCGALKGHAGTADLGQTVNIVGLDAQGLFNVAAHLLGPRLGTENAGSQLVVFGFVAALLQRFAQVSGVGGGAAEDGGTQVHHELDLTLGVTRGHGQGQTAHLVGTAVETCASRKQTVAVSYLANVFLGAAHSHDGPGTAVLPQVHVVLGVEGHDSAAGGTRGGLDADALGLGNCQESGGILVAEVVLGDEGELVEVFDAVDVVGGDTLALHLGAVVGDVVIDVSHLLDQLLGLQSLHLLYGHGFDFGLVVTVVTHTNHFFLYRFMGLYESQRM